MTSKCKIMPRLIANSILRRWFALFQAAILRNKISSSQHIQSFQVWTRCINTLWEAQLVKWHVSKYIWQFCVLEMARWYSGVSIKIPPCWWKNFAPRFPSEDVSSFLQSFNLPSFNSSLSATIESIFVRLYLVIAINNVWNYPWCTCFPEISATDPLHTFQCALNRVNIYIFTLILVLTSP